jgi:hypothetical protein
VTEGVRIGAGVLATGADPNAPRAPSGVLVVGDRVVLDRFGAPVDGPCIALDAGESC